MKSERRIAIAALAGGLALGGSLVATPPALAFQGIAVIGGGSGAISFRVVAAELQMGDNEFLQIVETSQTLGTYTVRIWVETEEAPGRPLLRRAGRAHLQGPARVCMGGLCRRVWAHQRSRHGQRVPPTRVPG